MKTIINKITQLRTEYDTLDPEARKSFKIVYAVEAIKYLFGFLAACYFSVSFIWVTIALFLSIPINSFFVVGSIVFIAFIFSFIFATLFQKYDQAIDALREVRAKGEPSTNSDSQHSTFSTNRPSPNMDIVIDKI